MSKQLSVRMQQRYNEDGVWIAINPILAPGEIGIESNTGKFKYGDGVKRWNELDYAFGDGMVSFIVDNINKLPRAADYPGAIAIVPREYTDVQRTEKVGNEETVITEDFTMDTPYISLRKNGLWYWTIFADQKDKPIASSALDYFQLDVSVLG